MQALPRVFHSFSLPVSSCPVYSSAFQAHCLRGSRCAVRLCSCWESSPCGVQQEENTCYCVISSSRGCLHLWAGGGVLGPGCAEGGPGWGKAGGESVSKVTTSVLTPRLPQLAGGEPGTGSSGDFLFPVAISSWLTSLPEVLGPGSGFQPSFLTPPLLLRTFSGQ